jgi:hypothetical protein
VQEGADGIYAQIEQSEYEIHWQQEAGAYMAPNRAQNLRFTFYDQGIAVAPRKLSDKLTSWNATLSLDSYGRKGIPGRRAGSTSWAVQKTPPRFKVTELLSIMKMTKMACGRTF